MKTNVLNRDVSFFRIEKLGREFWYNLYVRKRDAFQIEASFCSYEEEVFLYCTRDWRNAEEIRINKQLGKGFDSRRIEYKIDLKLFIYNCFENLKIHIIKNLWI